jgi:hypothetical protein
MADRIGGTLKPRPKPQKESAAALDRLPHSFSISCLAEQLNLNVYESAETARCRDIVLGEAVRFLEAKRSRYQRREARA